MEAAAKVGRSTVPQLLGDAGGFWISLGHAASNNSEEPGAAGYTLHHLSRRSDQGRRAARTSRKYTAFERQAKTGLCSALGQASGKARTAAAPVISRNRPQHLLNARSHPSALRSRSWGRRERNRRKGHKKTLLPIPSGHITRRPWRPRRQGFEGLAPPAPLEEPPEHRLQVV